MNRISGLLTVLLAVSTMSFAQGGTCGFFAHGTLHSGNGNVCWIFVADDGSTYQPFGGSEAAYSEGLSCMLVGTLTEKMGTCTAGPFVSVCAIEPDHQVSVVGVLRLLSDGSSTCWFLASGQKLYQPLSTEKKFYSEGAKVKVTGVIRQDLVTHCGGDAIEVMSWELLKKGDPADSLGACQSAYSECIKVCHDTTCYISCETAKEVCLSVEQ